jgi:anti-anti-sigma factor
MCTPGTSQPTESVCESLSVRLYRTGGRTVARVSGEADLEGARTLERALERALAFPGGLDLDLAAVRFCDCSGLNVLLRVRQRAEATGTTVTLRAASPCVERLLALTDTRALFTAAVVEPGVEPDVEPVAEPVVEHSRHPDEVHFTGLAAQRLVPPARAGGSLLVRCLGRPAPVPVHGSAFAHLGIQQQDPAAPAA